LGTRAGPIDLIEQHHIGEQRTGAEHERVLRAIEQVSPGDVRRHQVRGALDALEAATQGAGQCLAEQGLAQARHALDEHVSARHHRDAQCPHRRT